jgi:hypothetical protein
MQALFNEIHERRDEPKDGMVIHSLLNRFMILLLESAERLISMSSSFNIICCVRLRT